MSLSRISMHARIENIAAILRDDQPQCATAFQSRPSHHSRFVLAKRTDNGFTLNTRPLGAATVRCVERAHVTSGAHCPVALAVARGTNRAPALSKTSWRGIHALPVDEDHGTTRATHSRATRASQICSVTT